MWDLYSLQNPPRIVNQCLCLHTYSINHSQKWSTTNRIQIEWKKYSSPCHCKRVEFLGARMVGFSNQTTCLTLWRTGNLSGFIVASCPTRAWHVRSMVNISHYLKKKRDKSNGYSSNNRAINPFPRIVPLWDSSKHAVCLINAIAGSSWNYVRKE